MKIKKSGILTHNEMDSASISFSKDNSLFVRSPSFPYLFLFLLPRLIKNKTTQMSEFIFGGPIVTKFEFFLNNSFIPKSK